MSDWRDLQIRVHGPADRPTLIYLPGLHGDWTLVSSFRRIIAERLRFVEFTYPRTLTWSLEEHATRILQALDAHNIREGWVLAESFGSALAWDVLEKAAKFDLNVKGLILAGGFVRYPSPTMVRIAHLINRAVPGWVLRGACWCYGRYAVLRHRRAPETLQCVAEFVRRRTEEADRMAVCYRYELILRSDARRLAGETSVPVYQLCGLFDPIVPWLPVRLWLKRHCPAYKGWRLVWRADHNVLGTAPHVAADQILSWMGCSAHVRP